jgi:hypothetical protein
VVFFTGKAKAKKIAFEESVAMTSGESLYYVNQNQLAKENSLKIIQYVCAPTTVDNIARHHFFRM